MKTTENKKFTKALAVTFVLSGIWDSVAGFLYLTIIGEGRLISNPSIHPFYSIFMGSFFFCFAFLQFMSASNIKRYLFVVGSLVFGRIFYVILLYYYIIFESSFPNTFFFTGIVDSLFVILYLLFSYKSGIRFVDLFKHNQLIR
jgi:hypothetical protein